MFNFFNVSAGIDKTSFYQSENLDEIAENPKYYHNKIKFNGLFLIVLVV